MRHSSAILALGSLAIAGLLFVLFEDALFADAALVLSEASAATFNEAEADPTAQCLLKRRAPLPTNVSCRDAHIWRSARCLASEIPAWLTSFDLVSACFRCCLEHHVRSGVPAFESRRQFWSREISTNSIVARKHGHIESTGGPLSVLQGLNSMLQIADLGSVWDKGGSKAAGRLFAAPGLEVNMSATAVSAAVANP